jgi:hypothetical protein
VFEQRLIKNFPKVALALQGNTNLKSFFLLLQLGWFSHQRMFSSVAYRLG